MSAPVYGAAVGGDASSCSRLGAELRTRAADLLAAHEQLGDAALRSSRRGGLGPDPLRVARDTALLELVVDRLDTAGAALQTLGQELLAAAQDHRRLVVDAERAGLALDGLRVVEPWGVAQAEVASTRRAAAVDLQARADRLASVLARSRAAVRRTFEEGTVVLAQASARTRDTLGH